MSWLSNLFGYKKKDEGTTQAPILPVTTDYRLGKTVEQQIYDALNSGTDIGFGADYVNKSTSPLVASREAGWKQRELPTYEASLGARGMSRSTLGARDINTAFANKENDINSIIAQAYAQNEAQKKSDIARYQGAGWDVASQQRGEGMDQMQLNYNNSLRNNAIIAANKENNQGITRGLIGTGISGGNMDWSSIFNMATAAKNAKPFSSVGTPGWTKGDYVQPSSYASAFYK